MKKIHLEKKTIWKGIKKTLIAIIGISLIVGLGVLIINLIIVGSTSDQILTVEEAAKKDADCIIVLGAGVKPDGTPTWMLEDRILVGEELYQKQAAKKLLMSGDHGRVTYDEVNTMKGYCIEDGIPSEDIFMDHAGFETYDTMYRAKEVFGAKKVIIVTQKYHLYRSLYIANKLGLEAYGVSADLRGYGSMQSYREVREWLARVKSFGKCILKPEPKYLGDFIDIKASGDVTNDK